MEKLKKENWRETDLNVDSLWIFDERAKDGKHANIYHGNFIPQIPNQLIRRYTGKDERDNSQEYRREQRQTRLSRYLEISCPAK